MGDNQGARTGTGRISFGPMQVDWETRVDFEKLRRDRLQRTRDAMASFGVDYLILVRLENARYTTGFKRLYWPTIKFSAGPIVVVPREGPPALLTLDVTHAVETIKWITKDRIRPAYELDYGYDVETFTREVLDLFGPDIERAKVGVDVWSPAMYKVLPKMLPGVEFVDGQEVMIQARMIKTPEEIACMKMGYVISEAGMQAAVDSLKPGIRECELVGICFNKFWQLGAETTQCSQVVNSGPGTHPYRRFHTDRIIQSGDMVNMDFGACWNGYFGDFSRAFVCGRPSQEQVDLLRRAYDLQMETIAAIRPGVTPSQICEKLGRNNAGHGIGISAFEIPHLRATEHYVLQPGMTFCVITSPTGVATPATGGVHLEDQIVVTEDGCEVYSTYPYTGVNA